MKHFRPLFLALVGVLLAATAWLVNKRPGAPEGRSLVVYCAAGLQKPVEATAAQYQRETGVRVQLQYGGSGTLLSAVRVAHKGDLFLAADEGVLADARRLDLIREVIPLARQHPVIAVGKGNPKNIRGLADLTRRDIRVALANPEAASIGRVTRATLGTNYAPLAAHVLVLKPTVTEIANDIRLGAVDTGIIWDSIVNQFPGLEAIETPELSPRIENASTTVLSCTTQSAAGLGFARYLAAPEKGATILKRFGFTPAEGDRWAVRPEIILYSGGVNRPAIAQLLQQFSDREGVTVTTVFNGCGVLCATMKAMTTTQHPKFPDAYYACDLCFVPPVAEFFPEAVILTETDIGLVVKQGNPQGIHKLADLARPGLRVGLCNAEQSTLGYMTRAMLRNVGLLESVRKNVAVEVPTADFLVNQMRVGALDAAVVYRVNAAPQSQYLEFLPLDHPGAKAVQPFSVRGNTPYQQLARRLLAFLRQNHQSFEAAGFHWRGDQPPVKSASIEVPDWLKSK